MIQFIIGDGGSLTPLNEATEYTNTDCKDSKIKIHKNGFGYLFEGIHFVSHYKGGFILLNDEIFSTDEQYTIESTHNQC